MCSLGYYVTRHFMINTGHVVLLVQLNVRGYDRLDMSLE